MNKIFIHQIFYNAETRAGVAPEFIPLDNEKNEHPDWFEFWVMLNFLRSNSLEEDAWYGFLSPKFEGKAGVAPSLVIKTLETYGEKAEVALFSPGWDQLAYFVNPWEQGDAWHPGIMAASQEFLNQAGIKVDLKNLVATSKPECFQITSSPKKDSGQSGRSWPRSFLSWPKVRKHPVFWGQPVTALGKTSFP